MPRKTRRRRNTTRKSNLKKVIRKVARETAMRVSETKVAQNIVENTELDHNKPTYKDGFLNITQGDEGFSEDRNNVRIGDEIYLKRVQCKLWLSNKNDRPNCMYRIILFWYPSNMALSDANCFYNQTNKMIDAINTGRLSIIAQKYIKSGASYATGVSSVDGSAKEHSYLTTLSKNWRGKKIKYLQNQATPKNKNIGMCVVCYDAFGTLQTDTIASYAYNFETFFKDP